MLQNKQRLYDLLEEFENYNNHKFKILLNP